MPETYGISSLGKVYVIDEGFTETPALRYVYLSINALLYIIPTINITMQYMRQRTTASKYQQKSLWLMTSLFVTFVVNNAIRSLHMIDHHWRPVYYHEPRWAYQKYLITEMELATYANLLITAFGWIGIRKILHAIQNGNAGSARAGLAIFASYVFGSFFNLVHYTVEPPKNYGPFPNFTIAGSSISALPYFAFYLYILCLWTATGGDKGAGASRSKEQRKQLLQDDEKSGGEDDGKRSTRSSRARKRSKTPVKKKPT